LIAVTANSCWNIVNFRSGLIDSLENAGYRVAALAPEDVHAPKLLQRGIALEKLRIDSKGQSPRRDLLLLWQYRRALRRIRPAAMLSFTMKPNVYGSLAAASLGIPVINNVSGLGTAFIAGGAIERIVTALMRLAMRRSSTVFFQNSDDLSLFVARRIVSPVQAQLINGSGIDLDRFAPVVRTPEVDSTPEAVSTPEVDSTSEAIGPIFLQVGRLLRDKGVREFVEAARIVRATLPAARFRLLGPLGAANRTAVPDDEVDAWVASGLIDYRGEKDDVRADLAAADCVVLASYREGLPRSLIEAAAMGRPAIATDVPGCRAAVDDGVTGYLCAPRSGTALAEAMLRFAALDHEARNRMGVAARAKAVGEFDQKLVAAAYLDALARAGVIAAPNRTG